MTRIRSVLTSALAWRSLAFCFSGVSRTCRRNEEDPKANLEVRRRHCQRQRRSLRRQSFAYDASSCDYRHVRKRRPLRATTKENKKKRTGACPCRGSPSLRHRRHHPSRYSRHRTQRRPCAKTSLWAFFVPWPVSGAPSWPAAALARAFHCANMVGHQTTEYRHEGKRTERLRPAPSARPRDRRRRRTSRSSRPSAGAAPSLLVALWLAPCEQSVV